MSKIGEGAFTECKSLTGLIVGNPYGELNKSMFANCTQIITIQARTASKAETFVKAINDDKRFKFKSIGEIPKTTAYGDLDSDSKVSMQDVVTMQKFIAQLITELPARNT